MNKKSILIIVIALTINVFTSCKEDSPVTTVSGIRNSLGFGTNDEEIVALFRVCSWHRWHSDIVDSPEGFGPPYVLSNNYCWAYISDGTWRFVDPNSITCNGNSMKRLETGQYEYHSNIGHLSEIEWYIEDILGYKYYVKDKNLSKIEFINFNNDDTLEINDEIFVEYTGNLGDVEGVFVSVYISYYEDGSYTTRKFFDHTQFYPNTGKIVITREELEPVLLTIDKSRIAGGYIELKHIKYEEENHNGKLIGKLFETSMLNWFYLKFSSN